MSVITEHKIVKQICELLDIPTSSNSVKMLKAIRNTTFKNLREGAGADWGDPNDFREDRPWVEEMLREDAEAKKLFDAYCAEYRKKHP